MQFCSVLLTLANSKWDQSYYSVLITRPVIATDSMSVPYPLHI